MRCARCANTSNTDIIRNDEKFEIKEIKKSTNPENDMIYTIRCKRCGIIFKIYK